MNTTHRSDHTFGQHSMLFQMIALFATLTVIATALTGWLIYNRAASQLIDNAWTQNETLLDTARAAINRQFLQVRSFAWQISNSEKIVTAMYAREQTPDTILNVRDIIDVLQGVKAFMDTIADIGVHLYNSDTVITGESSYIAEKYYRQFGPEIGMDIKGLLLKNTGRSVLGAYAGRHTVSRLISNEDVLTFVSGLPISGSSLFGYSFINLNVGKLKELLPASEDSFLMLVDDGMNPLYSTGSEADKTLLNGICDLVKTLGDTRSMRYEGAEYGVLLGGTDVSGLRCMAVVPYRTLLKQAESIRVVTMLIICGCMLLGLAVSVWIGRKMYAPVARLTHSLKQLENAAPAKDKRLQNEIVFISEVIKTVTLKNKELALDNRHINRLLKSQLLIELIEGRLSDSEQAQQALSKSGIHFPYLQVQVAVLDLALGEHGLLVLEDQLGMELSDWAEQQMVKSPPGALVVYAVKRADSKLLVLFNIDAKHSHPEIIYDILADVAGCLESSMA
jgi:hypothetical protein